VPLSSAGQNKESEKGLFNTNKQKTNTRTQKRSERQQTGRSGESTGRSQNISLIVPLFTFAGHYRGIRML
jgi:hypothetical protein